MIDGIAVDVWATIKKWWREKIDAVITPTKVSRKIGDRHHFDDSNSDPGQLWQLLRRGPPGAFTCKRADVHFVNHLAFHLQARPRSVRPLKGFRIDNAR